MGEGASGPTGGGGAGRGHTVAAARVQLVYLCTYLSHPATVKRLYVCCLIVLVITAVVVVALVIVIIILLIIILIM